jgi:hypothetical protein
MPKDYGIKWVAIGNIWGNTLRTCATCWEHIGNQKIQKNSTPSPPCLPLFAPKEIKTEPLGCMFAKQLFNLKIPFWKWNIPKHFKRCFVFHHKILFFEQNENLYIFTKEYIYILCVCVFVWTRTHFLWFMYHSQPHWLVLSSSKIKLGVKGRVVAWV